MVKNISLQRSLVKKSMLSSMVAGLIALLIFMSLSFYHSMQMHDELMDEVADMLLMSDVTQQQGAQLDELSEEFLIQYQLRTQQQILTYSPDFQLKDIQPQLDFAVVWAEGEMWRSYVVDENNLRAAIYQPLSIRLQDLLQSTLGFIAVLLLVWLLQWGLLSLAIQRQFKSLKRLTHEIAAKNAQNLQPIQQGEPVFQELQPIVNQLNSLLQHLEHSLTAEQRFTADASHELRSPLSAIQMRLQVLQRKYQQQPQLLQDLKPIQNDIARSTQVLENLLLLARLDPSQAHDLPKTEFELDTVLAEVLQTLQPFIQDKKIQLQCSNTQLHLYANRELIFSCLRNLVDNAIRYSPMAGVIVIQLQAGKLCIENQGQLISAEVLQRLGERFYRVLGSNTQGSGLGLSICQKIMQLHAGTLEFQAGAEGGLQVYVQFDKKKQ